MYRYLVAILLLSAAPARAQPRLPRLSAADRSAALQRIKAELQASYVTPEQRPRLVEELERAQRSGRYDTDDSFAFAERVTEDLRAVAHDRHLGLIVDPAGYAAARAPALSDAGAEARDRREAIRAHHGIAELRVLPGNLRYVRITGFHWVPDETGAVYDDAARFLRDGDAIIIDLRGNGGGSHGAVQYLISHFLAPETLELTFLHGGESVQIYSLAHLPAGRLRGKPLYVLIDGRVASGAEAFAYDVQQFKLGELVGATTAGAANNNRLVAVAPAFVLSVSYGRPVHAVSHANWEGTGIAPTLPAEPGAALAVAQLHALDRLAKMRGATPEQRADYAWARVAADAALHPPVITDAQLAPRAGRYGDLAIVLRAGALWMQRPQRPEVRLSPLTADGLFAVDGSDLLRVRLTDDAVELLWPGQPARRFARGATDSRPAGRR